jgi:hypothetical protein
VSTPPDDRPIPETPGLEALFRALTAEGDATEVVGRQRALTMFRQARGQSALTQPLPAQPGLGAPGPRLAPVRRPVPRRRRAFRLAGVAAALLVACGGLTAAAYAQILPGPVQDIAHTVLAPLGVPSASHARPGTPSPGLAPSTPPGQNGPSPAPSAATSCPCPTDGASGKMGLRLSAARLRVAAGEADTFTGHVSSDGHPGRHVPVRLLARAAADRGTWRVAGTGLTSATGDVTFTVPHVPATTMFRLAGTGRLASLASPEVTVKVTPLVVVRHPSASLLTVAVYPSQAGDQVTLEQLQNGAWAPVATQPLTSLHKATFPVTAGSVYRFAVPATSGHTAAVSARFRVLAAATVARTATPVSSATPTATPSARRTRA